MVTKPNIRSAKLILDWFGPDCSVVITRADGPYGDCPVVCAQFANDPDCFPHFTVPEIRELLHLMEQMEKI